MTLADAVFVGLVVCLLAYLLWAQIAPEKLQ
jgi:hypothetical protein